MPNDLLERPDEDVDADSGSDDSDGIINHSFSPEEQSNLSQQANTGMDQPASQVRPVGPTGRTLGGGGSGGALGKIQNAEQNGDKGPGGAGGGLAGKVKEEALNQAASALGPEVQAALKAKQTIQKLLGGENRQRTLISGGVIGGVTLTIIFALVTLLPQSGVTLLGDLENRVFAVADHEISKESQNMVSHYITKRVGPRLACGATYNPITFKKCIQKSDPDKDAGDGDPVEDAYNDFDNENLMAAFEEKGITFSEDGGKYYMHADDLDGGKLDITKVMTSDNVNLFDYVAEEVPDFSSTLNSTVDTILQENDALVHYFAAQLEYDKYGVKSCVESCESQDNTDPSLENDPLREPASDQSDALAAEEERAVIEPTGAVEGGAVEEVLSDTANSDYSDTESLDTSNPVDAVGDATAGTKTKYEESTASALSKIASKYASRTLGPLLDKYNALKSSTTDFAAKFIAAGLSQVLGQDVTSDSVKAAVGEVADKLTPVQWILLAAQILNGASHLGTLLAATMYAIRLQPAISEFFMYSSATSEQRAGHHAANDQVLGSILGGLTTSRTKDLAGDKLSTPQSSNALQSPLLRSLTDPNNNGNLSPQTVRNYLVNSRFALDGFAGNDAVEGLQSFGSFMRKSGLSNVVSAVSQLAHYVNDILGPVATAIIDATGLNSLINQATTPMVAWLASNIYKLPNLTALSGEDRGTLIAAGGDQAGNDTTEALGGEANMGAASAQVSEAMDEQQQQFENQPLYARMFSTTSNYSFVSRLSLALPFGLTTTLHTTAASILSNPLGKLFDSFATLLHPDNVFAYSGNMTNPADASGLTDVAGIIQYARPDNDSVYSTDPETYYKDNDCTAQGQQGYPKWNANDPNVNAMLGQNGQIYHKTVNDCVFVLRTAQLDSTLYGGGFPINAGASSGASTPASASGPCQDPFRDIKNLRPERIDQGVDYGGTGTVYAVCPGKILNLTNTGWNHGGYDAFITIAISGTGTPADGKVSYMSEGCTPLVTVGQTVDANTPICTMLCPNGDNSGDKNSCTGIETGWATQAGDGVALAQQNGGYVEGKATALGENYNQFLMSLGAPSGTQQPVMGYLPSGWPSWKK